MSGLPQLPPELWIRVLHQHNNLKELWETGREVCKAWRKEVPKVFMQKYLQDPQMVEINFDLGVTRIHGLKCPLGIRMVFDRFDPNDGKRCIFLESEESIGDPGARDAEAARYRAIKDATWRKLKENMSDYRPDAVDGRAAEGDEDNFSYPLYQSRIKYSVNDTELPGLRFDLEKQEMSFEWQAALREAHGGDIEDEEVLMKEIMGFMNQIKNVRRDVRRERVLKLYRSQGIELDELDILDDEALALKRINDVECSMNFVSFAEDAADEREGERKEAEKVVGELEGDSDDNDGWTCDEVDEESQLDDDSDGARPEHENGSS